MHPLTTGDPHLLQTIPHPETGTSQVERSGPGTAEGRSDLQDPLQGLSRGVCRPDSRTLAHRLKEHKRTLTSGNLAQSAVAEHATQQSHAIDWECATVIDTEQISTGDVHWSHGTFGQRQTP